MDILNPKNLRQQAQTALRRGREPKKLIYAYAFINLGISAVVYLLNLWMNQQIEGTGGLGNLGTRAIFETVKQIIPIASSVISMILHLGFLGGMMRICRGQYADHTDLKTGIRKFWPMFRLSMLEALLYFAVAFLAMQLGSVIFLLTPWAQPLIDVLTPLYASGNLMPDEAMMLAMVEPAIPLMILTAAVILLAVIPFAFRLRMAVYCLMDDPKGRAIAAMGGSNRMMRGRFFKMLRIDLCLWLYYAATVVMMLVLYSDVILALLGIPAPMNETVFAGILYFASAVMQFGILVFLRPHTEMTYLKAYDALKEKKEDSTVVLGNIFDM